MSVVLGIDTSNYTTSCAIYDGERVMQEKMLLPVKKGQLGLRQSDAVFHHTNQLPAVIDKLFSGYKESVTAIGCSSRPRSADDSYMPCFLSGLAVAKSLSSINSIPLVTVSHQQGHIAAALYGADSLELINKTFIAFHVSGGTTEAVLVSPDCDEVFSTKIVACTLDLNGGQLIDRVGVMLGLKFPCGVELEKLALKCEDIISVKPTLKDTDCCLSGVQNKCEDLMRQGAKKEYIAAVCLKYIEETVSKMTERLLQKHGMLPVVYAGGVMSNSIIRNNLSRRFKCFFAPPEYSSDNAAGVAVLAYEKLERMQTRG